VYFNIQLFCIYVVKRGHSGLDVLLDLFHLGYVLISVAISDICVAFGVTSLTTVIL